MAKVKAAVPIVSRNFVYCRALTFARTLVRYGLGGPYGDLVDPDSDVVIIEDDPECMVVDFDCIITGYRLHNIKYTL